MPGTLNRIRREMKVEPTPRDKGLTLTLRVTAYDNGMIEVDGVPINEASHYDQALGWLGAADIVIATMSEFRRQMEKRPERESTDHLIIRQSLSWGRAVLAGDNGPTAGTEPAIREQGQSGLKPVSRSWSSLAWCEEAS